MKYKNVYNVDGLHIQGGKVQTDYTLHFLALAVLFLLTTITI